MRIENLAELQNRDSASVARKGYIWATRAESPKQTPLLEETVPRSETTLPCYLHTYITQEQHRQAIDAYVVVASKLYRRGTLILNLVAQSICGARLPGASDVTVSVLRPRFDEAHIYERFRSMALLLQPPDDGTIEENPLKHAFLPERWPTSMCPLDPDVETILQQNPSLPGVPDWRSIMSGTGWDNAVNRMMSKFAANVKVHACARIAVAAKKYMSCVPLDPETSRWLLVDCTVLKLRPIIAANDDWEMAMTVRRLLTGETNGEYSFRWVEWPVPEKTAYTQSVLLFHLFLARYGVAERSYLPVANRSRKYAYIDAKIARHLFKLDAPTKKTINDDVSASTSVGELLSLTPAEFNRRRRDVRAEIRRRYRAKKSSETNAERKNKLANMAERWSRIGSSHMPAKARVDSIETDGVGLRLILKGSPGSGSTHRDPGPGGPGHLDRAGVDRDRFATISGHPGCRLSVQVLLQHLSCPDALCTWPSCTTGPRGRAAASRRGAGREGATCAPCRSSKTSRPLHRSTVQNETLTRVQSHF